MDDDALLADGEDQATIIAYVLNELDWPAVNERVTFRIIRGPGNLEFLGEENRCYAAVYTAGTTPGEAVIEVALPTISRPIRRRITVTAVEAASLEARGGAGEPRGWGRYRRVYDDRNGGSGLDKHPYPGAGRRR